MKSSFQLITIIVFILLAVFGVLVFSGAIPLGGGNTNTGAGTVVLWGTVKAGLISTAISDFNTAHPTYVVQYVEKSPDTFDQNLLEALAAGVGPDMFFLPDNLAFHYSNKIFTIPYASYPLASFKSNFAGAGDVFLNSKGIMAFPIAVDPLVMYFNRSMLDANGVIYPPSFWDEFPTLVGQLTKKDNTNKINKSMVALGQFSNVAHAKDIIAAMFMQAGNNIVAEKDGVFNSVLEGPSKYSVPSTLKFYTDFADPNSAVYSWNKSFPNSVDAFSSENLALYFGFASELQSLVNRNPNQNFGVSAFPQIRGSNFKLTDAHVTGIAVSAFSKNFNTAFIAASSLATGDFAAKYASALGVAPARRDLLAIKPADVFTPIFYNSALFAKSWLDPASTDTDNIFRDMVEGVLSNNMTVLDAIRNASSKLSLLLIK